VTLTLREYHFFSLFGDFFAISALSKYVRAFFTAEFDSEFNSSPKTDEIIARTYLVRTSGDVYSS
jgi:hypothetical protein